MPLPSSPHSPTPSRRRPFAGRRPRLAAAAAGVAVAGTALFGIGQATADHAVPHSDREIPNVDLVKNQIAAYYGDTVDADGAHHASADSNYAKQVRGIAARAQRDLKHAMAKAAEGEHGGRHGQAPASGQARKKPAIVLDVDDTTLLTYTFERQINYAFDPKKQDDFLRTKDMEPVFGMRDLVNRAHAEGLTVFLLTGRAEYQREWSVRNLEDVGYDIPVDRAHFYLKDTEHPPAYLPCGADCTTVEYKSGTRAHIESLGYHILANFGDQYSDLRGGHADRTYKLPNPMYYLP